MKRENSNGMTLTRRIPPEEVLAKGHLPFLILYGGEEEEEEEEVVTPGEDEEVEEGERVEPEQHLVRKKRYVEISVDQNSFPNNILPGSLGVGGSNLETGMGRGEQETGEKFSLGERYSQGKTARTDVASEGEDVIKNEVAEEKVGSLLGLDGDNDVLPYPRLLV